jgi:hypothetical protein
MKFDKIVEQLLNEYALDFDKRMEEIERMCQGNSEAIKTMLIGDLRYVQDPSYKQSILDKLKELKVSPEEAEQKVADLKAPKGEVSGNVGVPTRSNYLKKFMSRERNQGL